MYKRTIWRMPQSIDVEITHKGRYGARGEKREGRRNSTPEEVEKCNRRQAEKRIRRKINMNFQADDLHMVLTYRKEERCRLEEATKNLRTWLDRMRYNYKKGGQELKYIITTSIGERGAVHHHVIINNIDGITAKTARKYWKKGRVYYTALDDTGEYGDLAAYIMKQDKGDQKLKYSCSRNLKMPKPEMREIRRPNWEEPKPFKGYYIDKGTVYEGINPVTGYPYQQYTMKKVRMQI